MKAKTIIRSQKDQNIKYAASAKTKLVKDQQNYSEGLLLQQY